MKPMNMLIQLVVLVAIISNCHGFWRVDPYQLACDKVLQTKPSACRQPNPKTCECRKFSDQDPCIVERWFYHPVDRTCEPYCLEGRHLAIEMYDIPFTRRECEDLCGDTCDFSYPNGTTLSEPGVCMGNLFCDITPEKSWWQKIIEKIGKSEKKICESDATRCCPKNYQISEISPFLKP